MNRAERVPWQVDYIFASAGLQPALQGCRTIEDASIWEASDHCPVVAHFDLVPVAREGSISRSS